MHICKETLREWRREFARHNIYAGPTEARAADELREGGADIRVFTTRPLRVITRRPGSFTARQGFPRPTLAPRNSHTTAQISGLEWNVRVSGAESRRYRQTSGGL